MKKAIFSLGLGVALIATGCKNKADKESILTPAETQNMQLTPATNETTLAQPETKSATVSTPAINTLPAASKGAINPAHGEPGHRCDIAVGAPLDSKPTTPATTTTTAATPANNTVTPVINNVSTNNGAKPAAVTVNTSNSNLNPEHGKPGHRCDIAVGAPLDSKPTTATVQPAANNSNAVIQTNAQKPAPVTPMLPTTTTVAPGMNPEHGKPGHRCDIAVGAPLTSAPKQ